MSINKESIHDVPTLINQFLATADDDDNHVYERYSHELSELILNDELTLLQFIQNLGPTLTSDNDTLRPKSVQCLASTLHKLNPSKLSKHDIQVLVQFLIAKFDDKICFIYILQSLNSIIKYNNFVPSINQNFIQVLKSLNDQYDPKNHLAKVRYEAFQILNSLLKNHANYIKSNSNESDLFTKTFIHVATGEKDPRNLLCSFGLNTQINQTLSFDINNETHQEFLTDLFDVCFCYFPISFTPPANDPYKIGANDLKIELRNTIASQSFFAKDSFSSLFEKLTSTNPIVRNDVLKCLLSCIENYNQDTILEYWLTIWNSLKFEILHNDVSIFDSTSNAIIPLDYENIDDTDDNKPLILTLAILKRLASVLSNADQVENYIDTITNELKNNLKSINDKTFKQSVIVLSTIASDSPIAYNKILKFIFSHDIWGKYIRSDSTNDIEELPDANDLEIDKNDDIVLNISKQRDLIDNLGFFLISYQILCSSDPKFIEDENQLKFYKDHILIFMGQLLQTSSNIEKTLKCKIIQQLIKLIQLPSLLNKQDYSLVFSWLNDNLNATINYDTKNWESDIVLKEITNGLIKILHNDHQTVANSTTSETTVNNNVSLVIELILPNLLLLLDDVENENNLQNYNKVLTIINSLCVNYQFLENLTIRLLNKLSQYNQNTKIDEQNKLVIIKDIINGFIVSFKQTQTVNPFLTNSWYKTFVPRFLNIILSINDGTVTELGGILIGLIIKYVEKSKHQSILNETIELFILNKPHDNINSTTSLIDGRSSFIGLFNNILASIDKSSSIDEVLTFSNFELIEKVTEFCYTKEGEDLNDSTEYHRLGYLQCLSLLVNKFTKQNDDKNTESLANLYHEIESYTNELTKKQIETFEIFIWKIKALVLRSDKVGLEYIDKLIKLLSNPNKSIRVLCSESFNIIMIDISIFTNQPLGDSKTKKIISNVNNLNVRLLYKQRLFEIVLPQLIESYQANENQNQEIYLITLSIILNNISTSILKPHLPDIFPLILSSLNIMNSVILEASLSTLKIIIIESPSLITPHLSNLVPKLVDLSTNKKIINRKQINDEKIRLLSLEALLGIFSTIELQYLIPFQKQAINKLVIGLDDKKRRVRKLSSDVRQVLYELGRS